MRESDVGREIGRTALSTPQPSLGAGGHGPIKIDTPGFIRPESAPANLTFLHSQSGIAGRGGYCNRIMRENGTKPYPGRSLGISQQPLMIRLGNATQPVGDEEKYEGELC
ncbi:MAG: hypothetical protein A2W25_12910 [candidate division Zixibacteria bacterium RBG_16_53_22]|nr:MAG: hypothetical protein A2W25_12910 [candidate division Zixibacteria bacterium RBG_16_53_22]